ncbi:hypothetical protein BT69DRAFT_1310419 [Atractiella rhizophila]|nr:hypothetical protein BT69DRAFT_1310419 [Atractiella rhizophila]
MNLGPGGKQPVMHDGWWSKDGIKVPQPMMDVQGVPKGMRAVLQERGLWRPGLQAKCKHVVDHTDDNMCCTERLLGSQHDFLEQKPQLQELLEHKGHHAIFLPKFHCENNCIEFVSGHAKRYTRANCDYTFEGLRRTVPEALKSIKLSTIRKFEHRSHHWIRAYKEGKNVIDAGYQVKEYASHRRIPEARTSTGDISFI